MSKSWNTGERPSQTGSYTYNSFVECYLNNTSCVNGTFAIPKMFWNCYLDCPLQIYNKKPLLYETKTLKHNTLPNSCLMNTFTKFYLPTVFQSWLSIIY